MKRIANLALILFSISASAQEDFAKYKWRNRIVVLSTQDLTSEKFISQWERVKSSPKKLDDRYILLFALAKGHIYDKELKALSGFHVSPLRKRYDIPTRFEGFTLIGKDGGVKMQKNTPFDVAVIFETIDNMPMRQREMRENLDD